MRLYLYVAVVAAFGCKTTPEPAPMTERAVPAQCGSDRPVDGSRLAVGESVSIWYKAAGNPAGPVVLFLHGGPGYNSYAFERTAGRLLEPHVRMVYLDQRGCARSWFPAKPEQLGIKNTVEDIEKLRVHLGVERLVLLGHSFGGLVALEYQRAYANNVAGLILAETSGDIAGALEHQLSTLAAIGPEKFPEQAARLREIATSNDMPFKKIMAAYEAVGRLPLQRQLHFASDAGQKRNEDLDAESGLMECDSGPVASKYFSDGYIDSPHPELMRVLPCPAVVFAGRKSNVIGETGIQAAAQAWKAEVHWFENSGHFIYTEEPEAFSRAVVGFASRAGADSDSAVPVEITRRCGAARRGDGDARCRAM